MKKDDLKNLQLNASSWCRYFTNVKRLGSVPDLTGMQNVYSMFFNQMELGGLDSNFEKGYAWGNYHPDQLISYYNDHSMVILNENDSLELKCKHKAKKFIIDGKQVVIPFAEGVIRSKRKFKYGYFQALLKLPPATSAWPGFWLCGVKNWPPEIDILEGYCNNTTNYKSDKFPYVKLQSNVHYRENGEVKSIGGKDHPLKNNVTDSYNYFGVLWKEDKIEFYYNNWLVRVLTDKNILDKINEPMEIILNMGIQKDKEHQTEMSMFVKEIRVWQ